MLPQASAAVAMSAQLTGAYAKQPTEQVSDALLPDTSSLSGRTHVEGSSESILSACPVLSTGGIIVCSL